MPVTNYHTIDGEIIGQTTVGSPRVDYLTDALGSVTATVNQSGSVINTYRYKPFGALLAKTGIGADPDFGWVGTRGYRPTTNKFGDFYVMLRHCDELNGRWPTQDPSRYDWRLWNLYIYVNNRPILLIDPSGLNAEDDLCAKWYNSSKWHSCKSQWNQCLRMCGNIGNVDHCCTDSPTAPVTPRECKCINPICQCGCGGKGGPNCTCKGHGHTPPPGPPARQPVVQPQPSQPPPPQGQLPVRKGDQKTCRYKCPPVTPTFIGGSGGLNSYQCRYKCTLIPGESSIGCPSYFQHLEGPDFNLECGGNPDIELGPGDL